MPAGADPRTEETTDPHPPHRGGPPARRHGRRGTKGGPGLFPQDPTVRHLPTPRGGPGPRHRPGPDHKERGRVYDVSTHEHTPGGAYGRARVIHKPHSPSHYRGRGSEGSLERR